MNERRVWPTAALLIAMVAALLAFVPAGQVAQAAQTIGPPAQPMSVTSAPALKAKTYFTCVWKGQTITVKHLANAPVERYRDSVLAGQCSKFKTNDKYYSRLVGKSLNVFVAWAEYPGQFIVHNAKQGAQPVYGDWSFPIGLQAPATMSGKITDSVTLAPIAGATVTATHCVTKPTRSCTSYTAQTNSKGAYTLRFYVPGSYKVTVTTAGYTKSAPTTVKVVFGNATTTNVALVQSAVSTSLTVSASPNPVNVNQSTTVTVTVGQPVNDGTISVTGQGPNGVSLTAQMCTPVSGTCTFSWQPSAVGAWQISATWSGDSHYTQATNSVNVQVTALSTTLSLASNPTQPTPGHAAQVTATLGLAANDGTVTFTASGPSGATASVASCTPISGACTSSWTPSASGTWTLSATWSGDNVNAPATGQLQVPVGAGTLTVVVTSNPASATAGQAVTATSTLSQPVSDGTVTFTFAGPAGATATSRTCTPIAGACNVSFTPSTSGLWTITASWSGDSQYNQATGTGSVSVGSNTLTVVVTSTPTQVTAGQTGTLAAVFSKSVSDGVVTFTVTGPGNPQLTTNSCTPTAGTCSITWKPSLPGTYAVTASWSGDSQYQGATSTPLSVTVTTTTLTLVASPTSLALGTSGALTATINQSVNDGTVTFTATGPNGITVAVPTCVPTNGTCSVQWTPSTSGSWSITANWAGDGTYPSATSAAAVVSVTGSATLSLIATPPSVANGQSTTLVATLANQVSDGTITFTGINPSGTTVSVGAPCTPTSGVCQTTSQALNINGAWRFTATWSGDASYPGGATSAAAYVTVTGSSISHITVSSSANPVPINTQDTLTALISPAVSDGQVTFNLFPPSGSSTTLICTPINGGCHVSWQPTVAGNWVVSATWSGDSQFSQSSSTPIQVSVNLPGSSLTVSANPNPLMPNQSGTLTATLNQSVSDGTVTFTAVGPAGSNANLNPTNGECTPVSGVCSIHWQPDTPGTWTVSATWSGDSQYGSSTNSTTVNVNGKALSLSVTPNPIVVSTAGTLKATMSSTTGTDTITFTQTNPNGVTTSAGTCTVNISNTPTSCTSSSSWVPNLAGTWTINASVTSGPDTVEPVSQQVTVTTGTSSSSMVLSTSPTPRLNQNVTVTAALAQSVNDGTISFTATAPGGVVTNLPSCVPSNGICSTTWTPNVIGSWTISATWTGDAAYKGSSATLNVAVSGEADSLALSLSNPTPTVNSSTFTVTATVTPTTASDGTITFTFKNPGGNVVAQPTCTPGASGPGACTVSFTPTSTGTWSVSATYAGSSTYASANAGPVQFTVSGAPTTLTLSTNPTSPYAGASGTTITASLANPVNDGTVNITASGPNSTVQTFTCGGTSSIPVSNGSCTVSWTPPVGSQGSWTITATWSGDSQFASATAAPINVTVQEATLTVAVASNPATPSHTSTTAATLTATLSAANVNDGLVTFTASGSNGGNANLSATTCTPSGSSCQVTWKPDTAGTWTVTASWSGDSKYQAASQTITVTVD